MSPSTEFYHNRHQLILDGGTHSLEVEPGLARGRNRSFSVHYTAYYRRPSDRPKAHPGSLTVFVGGGPGGSTAALQFGGMGPIQIPTDRQDLPLKLPGIELLRDANVSMGNPAGSDLLFLESGGTGFSPSSALDGTYVNDAELMADVIVCFIDRRIRDGQLDPRAVHLNLVGPSFGGARIPAIATLLLLAAARFRIALKIHDLIGLAPTLNNGHWSTASTDTLPFQLLLPTCVASAHAHPGVLPPSIHKLPLETVLAKVEDILPDYAKALNGNESARTTLAPTLKELTGLPVDILRAHRFRITRELFFGHHGWSRFDGRRDSGHIGSLDDPDDYTSRMMARYAQSANGIFDILTSHVFDRTSDPEKRVIEEGWRPAIERAKVQRPFPPFQPARKPYVGVAPRVEEYGWPGGAPEHLNVMGLVDRLIQHPNQKIRAIFCSGRYDPRATVEMTRAAVSELKPALIAPELTVTSTTPIGELDSRLQSDCAVIHMVLPTGHAAQRFPALRGILERAATMPRGAVPRGKGHPTDDRFSASA